ncbi:Phosphoribosyl 1,2-cyclic phosphodiesterase [Anaerobranca californiensis DSM 14826]|uniref:Phosphoribosyl 1,2-cyclic phosphodiesterase n=1 Tax=Anaerobranca californiensis DSM 14826 TaxID=1120989 RepID=A0A1M6M4L4_9FIRM|nr:MBL fold metallo-hydrolase [Anaerobranca californiensis]SHJ78428.1 Phosphoribosyl 1,2-cyclic phosphodiesterase [Anaerobranca californiensis DSM 14826]
MNIFSIASGSSGNCIYYSNGETEILIDAGLSGKKIQLGLGKFGIDPKNIKGILVTHEHKDHICGVGILSRKYKLPIYITEKTYLACKESLGKIDKNLLNHFEVGKKFSIGSVHIESFKTYHDAAEPVGFTFTSNDQKLGILTDTGRVDDQIMAAVYNSDTLLLESNHDEKMVETGPYPWYLKKRILGDFGHLSNTTAGKILAQLLKGKTRKVLLAHLSEQNNFPQLAKVTVENILLKAEIAVGIDVNLDILPRKEVSNFIKL